MPLVREFELIYQYLEIVSFMSILTTFVNVCRVYFNMVVGIFRDAVISQASDLVYCWRVGEVKS